MVVTTVCVCGPSSRIIFFSGVSSFVLFPRWQLGEAQLYYGVIFICFFETSAGMIYFYQEIKGGDFWKISCCEGTLEKIALSHIWVLEISQHWWPHQGGQRVEFNVQIPRENQSTSLPCITRFSAHIWKMLILNQILKKKHFPFTYVWGS